MLVAAPAGAATSRAGLYITGAGDGHGVGMSQYGAAGYALHGAGYQQILRDYYTGTTIGRVSAQTTVTVLLATDGTPVISGASAIRGSAVELSPTVRYRVLPAGRGRLRMLAGRRIVGTFAAPVQVSGPAPLTLIGQGSYRGAFVFRPSRAGGGVMTVNAVPIDQYVRGVVAAEMPSGWPEQALEAQAVAARTYALTSPPVSPEYDLYDNTRSQVYGGVAAETPRTNRAVAATSGQVVEYGGRPVVTFFFASSGGQTESVQNVFDSPPRPWLVSRPDPYDDSYGNRHHRWSMRLSLGAATARLGGLVHGALRGIQVLVRGVSPRIVLARVVGTRGSATVPGLQLAKDLGAPSAWMSIRTVTAHGVFTSTTPAASTTTTTPTGTETGTTTSPSGGGGLSAPR